MKSQPTDKILSNLKREIQKKQDDYLLKLYAYAIKTVAGTINLESEFPLASRFDGQPMF